MARSTLATISMVLAAIVIVVAPVSTFLAMATPDAIAQPDGPSESEQLVLLAEQRSLSWGYLLQEHPTLGRPSTDVVRVVTDEEWAGIIEPCVTSVTAEYGLDWGTPLTVQLTMDGDTLTTTDVAYQVCLDRYPTEGQLSYLLNDAQIGYLYDYYVSWVIPCLASAGYQVSDVPEREEFITNYSTGIWSPYWSAYDGSSQRAMDAMYDKCSAEPAGLRG